MFLHFGIADKRFLVCCKIDQEKKEANLITLDLKVVDKTLSLSLSYLRGRHLCMTEEGSEVQRGPVT